MNDQDDDDTQIPQDIEDANNMRYGAIMNKLQSKLQDYAQEIKHELGLDTVVIVMTKHDQKTNATLIGSESLGNKYATHKSVEEYLDRLAGLM